MRLFNNLDVQTVANAEVSEHTQGLVRVLQIVNRKHEGHYHPVDLAHQLLLINVGELSRGRIGVEEL